MMKTESHLIVRTVIRKSKNALFEVGDLIAKFRDGRNNCHYWTRISDGVQQRIHSSYLI